MLLALTIHSVAAGASSDAKTASLLVTDVMKQAGRTGGLVVLLDNGDTTLADAFSKRPQFLLQALTATEARYLQLRDHAGAQSNDSRATAMTYAPGRLPYADGIVSTFVAEEFGPDAGIGVADLVRCLSPNVSVNLFISEPSHGNRLCRAIRGADTASFACRNNNIRLLPFFRLDHLYCAVGAEVCAETASNTLFNIARRYDRFSLDMSP